MTGPRPEPKNQPPFNTPAAHPVQVIRDPVKTEIPSPWMQHTLWIADPSAAPVEYLEPLRELGFTQLCVRLTHGMTRLPVVDAISNYIAHGWYVTTWGRCDQQFGEDVREDPLDALHGAGSPFAANVEIRWDESANRVYAKNMRDVDALCTYPGGIPDGAHRYYQQAGVRVCLVQTFGETEPWGVSFQSAWEWGTNLGYEIVLPMVGTFKGTSGYADADAQRRALGGGAVHAYLVEQSGWRHMSGQGYDFEALMRGVR